MRSIISKIKLKLLYLMVDALEMSNDKVIKEIENEEKKNKRDS